ncbi:long-chain fatty acid transport protein [Candidatus Methylospira mobilis]|uniref:Long-chain fatty acid transport protein n=1 Tax=Candidatus Methylospira mobilis TaxID=1808979 RepID=A0A5Q0BHA5_9GAMM|nr:outer membrane protein transport protein [Candidatus Methylospira mobilis]QFY43213.1 long-chain fatty acid transport protein [Candidatus Methylospira mobilis]WNV03582.1 outer membrane protein transport protein [Candidatus Methylospira mobilis]
MSAITETQPARSNVTRWTRKALLPSSLLLLPQLSFALNTGTDLDLSLQPIAGGMAGAAFTRPQEVAAALFGNPATLSLFKGYNFEFGASILEPQVTNTQTSNGYSNSSPSQASNYIAPVAAVSGEVLPDVVLAGGLNVDSGLGANYTGSPINAGAGKGLGGNGSGGAATLPLLDELLSFSANIGAGWAATPDLSLGAAVTIGFGLAQLGTSGNTSGLQGLTGNFGGTTSSVHNISARGAFGVTYKVIDELTVSASLKTPLQYNYANVVSTTVGGTQQYQSIKITQPLEVQWGLAGNVLPNWLIEADALWKNWSNSSLYQDIYQDQFLALLGTQYTAGSWSFRGGYSYATALLRNNPNGTIGGLSGVGTLPFNTAVSGVLNSNDLTKVVQTTLAPVVWQNTLTAGLGYAFTDHFRLDGWGAYAFQQNYTASTLALGNYSVAASEWALGAGVNFKF